MNRHGIRVIGIRNLGTRILRQAKHLLILRIGHTHVNRHDTRHLDDLPGLLSRCHRRLRRRGIGAHQATRPQQRATKIARYHAANIFEPSTAKHLERRHAAGSTRFTVVALTLASIDQNPSGNIVSSIVMTLADHLDKGIRLILRLNMDQLGNKPALTVHKLARSLNIRLQSKIAVQQSPSTTSKATNSLDNTAKAVPFTPVNRTATPMTRQKQRDGVS